MNRASFPPLRRFRLAMGMFIVGLVISGLTAFPLLREVELLDRMISAGNSPTGAVGLANWIATVRSGLANSYAAYPWLAYGTDWLAFAHLAIALFFIGPLIDPRSSRGNLLAGLAASVGVIPLALIAGHFRGIPLGWRLVDCSFGVFGFLLLYYCLRLLPQIETGVSGEPWCPTEPEPLASTRHPGG